jgi:hypothetical protein
MRWDWTGDWSKGSDYVIEVFDTYDVIDPDAPVGIDAATVTLNAYNDIAGGSALQGPTVLDAHGDGRYTATLADDTAVERGMRVRVEVTVDDGATKMLLLRGVLVVR